MCGRFTITSDGPSILKRFGLDQKEFPFHPRYNLAPGQIAPVITKNSSRQVFAMKWGLVPHWAKDPNVGFKMINARAETLAQKPSFRHPFRHKRCLIPGDSFYEWKKDRSTNSKIPFRFHLKEQKLFAFAGLWEEWINPQGSPLQTFSIVTTNANSLVSPIHDRMPAILNEEDESIWLDHSIDNLEIIGSLLKPYPRDQMDSYKVSPLVNSVKNDSPKCLETSIELSQADLFMDFQ
ncbi:MAG: putative SOS response-associated peptidase YedK [Chlamydiales bacterium]|jgi:putative SOS response-associated peptidase YedK